MTNPHSITTGGEPRAKAPVEALPPGESGMAAAPAEIKVNILLVDDDAKNLLALEAVLENLQQNVVKARSGPDALRCLLDNDFAVVLMDVRMPDMSGFEAAELIRARGRSRHTPIIFLTAYEPSDMQ